ncbi:MAG: hypothetical protein RML10_10715 [Geminocystis sp.]|nr:hypothetical protein [Geminocystis sp.]
MTKDSIKINGNYYRNFCDIKEDVYSIIGANTNIEDMSMIHGDLCFSNILIDIDNMIIKLVDVRGEFCKKDIFGDIRYDIAKISHSSIGGYENILFGFYDLKFIGSDIEFEIHSISNQQRENHIRLTLALIEELGYDPNLIMLITGLLFISMTPLHSEDRDRQLAQYINGVIILNNALDGKYKP